MSVLGDFREGPFGFDWQPILKAVPECFEIRHLAKNHDSIDFKFSLSISCLDKYDNDDLHERAINALVNYFGDGFCGVIARYQRVTSTNQDNENAFFVVKIFRESKPAKEQIKINPPKLGIDYHRSRRIVYEEMEGLALEYLNNPTCPDDVEAQYLAELGSLAVEYIFGSGALGARLRDRKAKDD